jgi:hypothetical protein
MFRVDQEYQKYYYSGWDSRMSDIYVNPYILDFDSERYCAWKHGWDDCNIELESEDDFITRNS